MRDSHLNEGRKTFLEEGGKDLSALSIANIKRPPLAKPLDEINDTLYFMQNDIDYYYSEQCIQHNEGARIPDRLPLKKNVEHCVVQLFGATKTGQSILAHVHGYQMYLWVELINMERAPDPDEVRYGNSPVLNQMGKESSSEEESEENDE